MSNRTIQLQNQDGNIVEFDVLGFVEYEDQEYIVLYPNEQDDGEVLILQVDEDENYLGLEDDDLIETIFDLFKQQYQDDYIFEDEEEDYVDFEIEIEEDEEIIN